MSSSVSSTMEQHRTLVCEEGLHARCRYDACACLCHESTQHAALIRTATPDTGATIDALTVQAMLEEARAQFTKGTDEEFRHRQAFIRGGRWMYFYLQDTGRTDEQSGRETRQATRGEKR